MSETPRKTSGPGGERTGPASGSGPRRVVSLPKHIEQPNMTPMIDIVFNLLIFFLCAGNFNQPEGLLPSRLPKSHGVAAAGDDPRGHSAIRFG